MQNSLELRYEELITAGGDSRLLIGDDGLNRYGCSPQPRDAVALGSCTCSTPSARGIQAAKWLLEQLRQADDPAGAAKKISRHHRSRLKSQMELPRHVEVAFCPSGTDAELLVLALAAAGHDRPIMNIIVGPTEVGSGTPQAAAGLHYDHLVPRGGEVKAGTAVSRELAERVSVKTVNIRDERGEMLNEFYIDALVTEMVSEAVAEGAHVLLHLVAHSKTGMHAPSLECVDRITRKLAPDVTIVIDAAQGRVSRRGLNDALWQGHLVMFTGSKFYGGPAFSGALFVPPQWQPEPQGITRFPDEFDQYFTAAALPESWTQIRSSLTDWPNYGALLRWEAALAEIDAYYEVPNQTRLGILRAFEEAVPQVFAGSKTIRLMPVFPPIQDDSQTRLLESKTTVFSFQIETGGQALDLKELKTFHRELNSDVQNAFRALPAGVMSKQFHVGQPVPFQDGSAALRIALGGEMIVRIATDASLGESLEARLDWLRSQLNQLREKVEFLAAERVPAEMLLPETMP